MGSLWGHVDEGVVFISIATWWMVNMFREYIKVGGGREFRPLISYTSNIRGRQIPIEIYLKIFCSVGGCLIEMFHGEDVLYDKEGNFSNTAGLQHMSIYALFFTHSVLDLLRHYKLLYIEGLDYLTLAFSFIWYGLIFVFHTQHKTDGLRTIVHVMGLLWCVTSGLAVFWQYRSAEKFVPCYCKVLAVMGLGTWFTHTPFYLFSIDSFPGEAPNPRWDRDNKENYQVIATLFGFHLCVNIILSVLVYAIMRCVTKNNESRETIKFQKLGNGDIEQCEESNKLLSDEEEEITLHFGEEEI